MYEYERDAAILRLADEFESDHAFAAPPESWEVDDLPELHRYRERHDDLD
ncbi:MAG: hypothetical protein JJU06_22225 [Ectothiorhodospiraceae bacterium]|nr:hypothetical protein [Ectothiorhodospiraceae bacterium]MCH8505141.1 hypothetical protein [Ectothiorhodospiraceae bacterium]